MRHALVALAALVILGALPALGQDTRFYTPPVVTIPKVKTPPKVDGIIEPGEWAEAVALSPFLLVGGRGLPVNATEVWAMHDDHNLYVAALLHDPNPAALKATATERDGPVWDDDSFELFFDTEDQRKSYIHLAANPKETQYDALMKDKSADYRWTVRAATLANGWSVEVELPFANDYPPAPGISWGFSVARHSAGSGEASSWVRCLKNLHELGNFGSLIFAQTPLSLQITALGSLWLGENTAQISARNQGDKPAACKLNARVMGRDKHGDFFGVVKLNLPPGARESENVTYKVMEDGFSTVTFALSDAIGKTVWRSAPYPVVTPAVEPQIAGIEQALAMAVKEWMALPDGAGKKAIRDDLDGLTVQWRYLVSQYRDRNKLERAQLEALATYADKLKGDAEMIQKRTQSAKTSGRLDARFAVTAVPSLRHVFPDESNLDLDLPAALDACRNESEAIQLVVLPFRQKPAAD